MTEQLEAHGLYILFIATVLVLIVVMTVDAIAQARRDRRRRLRDERLIAGVESIQLGLVAQRNIDARLQG